jgi:hypothetical protein
MRSISVLIAAVVALISVFAAAAAPTLGHQATPPSADVPIATAPHGLGTVVLPTDEAGIIALLARLPATVAGEPRAAAGISGLDRIGVAYGAVDSSLGPPLSIQVQDIATGDFFPAGFAVADFVRAVADVPDYGTEAVGKDGTLYWVRAMTTVGVAGEKPGTPTTSRPLYTLAWGEASSSWLFYTAAFTRESHDALVIAFVIAAGGQPPTLLPGASPSPAATPAM